MQKGGGRGAGTEGRNVSQAAVPPPPPTRMVHPRRQTGTPGAPGLLVRTATAQQPPLPAGQPRTCRVPAPCPPSSSSQTLRTAPATGQVGRGVPDGNMLCVGRLRWHVQLFPKQSSKPPGQQHSAARRRTARSAGMGAPLSFRAFTRSAAGGRRRGNQGPPIRFTAAPQQRNECAGFTCGCRTCLAAHVAAARAPVGAPANPPLHIWGAGAPLTGTTAHVQRALHCIAAYCPLTWSVLVFVRANEGDGGALGARTPGAAHAAARTGVAGR